MIFRKKKNYEKIIYVIFLILYVILLLETTLMGRRHTDPLLAVFTRLFQVLCKHKKLI